MAEEQKRAGVAITVLCIQCSAASCAPYRPLLYNKQRRRITKTKGRGQSAVLNKYISTTNFKLMACMMPSSTQLEL
ncbi:hypothetical protein BC939DRAFT_465623 [Gamsiella multidivaricata]|uniref:uncharacterized protein n=1 Tax=Gamsiella multidivaricata TaxID=101098 RepID=UPI0022200AC4|nr:uncharacterized protein BC939DRAFT_465623 [Gamsiella multidivaricata]KAI7817527.1 hypothetical protein BC939DRAFT_465623 [Gamsiella multidivaricata]